MPTLDPARATDIEIVRKSLTSFFDSMIEALEQTVGTADSDKARFLGVVKRHALELPGIGQPAVLEDDEEEDPEQPR